MFKAIHVQESKRAALEKAKTVAEAFKERKRPKEIEDSVEETFTYTDFSFAHWTRIRTNNVIERLNKEIRRRTRVVGGFPGGNFALMLVCARLHPCSRNPSGETRNTGRKHLDIAGFALDHIVG